MYQPTIPQLLNAILQELKEMNKNLKKEKNAKNQPPIEKRERKTP